MASAQSTTGSPASTSSSPSYASSPPPSPSSSDQHSSPPQTLKSENSSLEIAYSTISPKIESQSAPPFPMQIKLKLIDQNPLPNSFKNSNGDGVVCESPFPMTPSTPGSATSNGDMSKKQRHNLREQRRILRISNQFDILRNKLEAAGYTSAKKDKFSVLQAALEYITYLERNQTRPMGSSILPPTTDMDTKSTLNPFMIDSMPSPVPEFSIPSFPMELDAALFGSASESNTTSFSTDLVEGSAASYRDVFTSSSMPSFVTKLDGTIIDSNSLFVDLSKKTNDELRLHSLYTMCTPMEAPKMYSLVNKILACEVTSAQCKMIWNFANSSERKVFVSISVVNDPLQRPANLHISLLPLS